MSWWEAFAAAFRLFSVVAAMKAAGLHGQIRTAIHAVQDGNDLGEFPFITITI